jgi:hypothetical protein
MLKRQILSVFILSFLMFGGFGPAGNVSNARVPYKKAKAKSAEGSSESLSSPKATHSVERAARTESLNLLYGQGGREGAPNLSDKFTFVEKDRKGASLKIHVRDSEDKEWTVKFGRRSTRNQCQPDRLGNGHHTDNDYLVRRVHIDGWGDAQNVRFERRMTDSRISGTGRGSAIPSMERASSTGSRCSWHCLATGISSTSITR